MAFYREDHEYDETPDEYGEEDQEERIFDEERGEWVARSFEIEPEKGEGVKEVSLEEKGVKKEYWNQSIDDIKNPKLREKRINEAKEIIEEETQLNRKLDSGEISSSLYDYKRGDLMRKRVKFSMRADLDAMGASMDHFIDLAEEAGDLPRMAQGDLTYSVFSGQVKRGIETLGPDLVQELADDKLEKGKITKEVHDTVSRKVRIARHDKEL